jgi:chaperone modulatory protein CbpM
MTNLDALIDSIAPLERADLEAWIREALVVPDRDGNTLHFSEMDCARIRLICTLRYELEIGDETLPVVMSLLDQLYEARERLNALTSAVTAQPKEVQEAVMAVVQRSRPG